MTKDELFELSGLEGVIDTALPQQWYDKVQEATGQNPIQSWVWWYPPGYLCGKPLSVAQMYAEAWNRGAIGVVQPEVYERSEVETAST